MKKAIEWMQKIQIAVGGFFLCIFLLTVVFQMLSRYIGIAATWTEDVSMYSFIWAVFMGAGAMVYEKRHFAFTSVSDMLKNEKIKSVLAIIISLVMLVFAVLMAYYGYKLTQKFWNYTWTNIPSFKRGPTWTCLPICGVTSTIYLIAQIKKRKLVRGHDGFPVWVDSPLAVEATGIYAGGMTDYYDEETLDFIRRGENPLRFDGLNVSVTSEDSVRLNKDKNPKIIISASGMCEAGRIRHHLKHNLWRPDSTVLFVGYQAAGTLGRMLAAGAKKVRIFGEEISVKARIATLAGTSGHADRDMLLGWLGNIEPRPKKVFVNHGDDNVCDLFAGQIREKYGIEAIAPYNGAEYELPSGACLYAGNRKKIEKKDFDKGGVSAVYARLLQAGRRLSSVIEKHRRAANKDVAKLTDQINDLCKKWED